MKPTSRIVFSWDDKFGRKEEFFTLGMDFKEHAIMLLEESLDYDRELYYTIDESDPIKLCYYNAEF